MRLTIAVLITTVYYDSPESLLSPREYYCSHSLQNLAPIAGIWPYFTATS